MFDRVKKYIVSQKDEKSIDWDGVFRDIIKELAGLDRTKGIGKLFEQTLVDYVPYAAHINGWDIDNSADIRMDAVSWIYLRHGGTAFRNKIITWFGPFSDDGTTCSDHFLNRHFAKCITACLEDRMPGAMSFGRLVQILTASANTHIVCMEASCGRNNAILEDYAETVMRHVESYATAQKEFDRNLGIDGWWTTGNDGWQAIHVGQQHAYIRKDQGKKLY